MNVVELDEVFGVALGTISGLDASVADRVTISGSPASATIVNDDAATLTITGPGTINEGSGSGTTAFEFTVTLSDPIASPFSVAFQTSDQTATVADSDYIDNDATISFDGTAGSQTITVLVNQDSRVEPDETFQVTLGQVSGLDSTLAGLLSVNTSPVTATIANDETATIGFASDASSVLEADGQISVAVRLDVPGGGSLSEPATVNVVVRDGGSASSSDFVLATSSVTFAGGSADGEVRNVLVTLAQDDLDENLETILIGLEQPSGGSTEVSLGSMVLHTVSVSDDTRTGQITGRVWVDADNDGDLDLGEVTIQSVEIRLSGTTPGGEVVERQTTTDENGFYHFDDLPAGIYSISQTQPDEFVDGQDVPGVVSGALSGVAGDDEFREVTLEPSQVASGFHFGERGFTASQVTRFRFLARPRHSGIIGNALTSEMLGNSAAQSPALSSNSAAEGELSPAAASPPESSVRQSGSQLIVSGTSQDDRIRITPAATDSATESHVIEINGERTRFDADEIDSILIVDTAGSDQLVIDDTAGDDALLVERDRVILESGSSDLRIEAIAVDLITAVSESGGQDRVTGNTEPEALDFVLKLEGTWDPFDA